MPAIPEQDERSHENLPKRWVRSHRNAIRSWCAHLGQGSKAEPRRRASGPAISIIVVYLKPSIKSLVAPKARAGGTCRAEAPRRRNSSRRSVAQAELVASKRSVDGRRSGRRPQRGIGYTFWQTQSHPVLSVTRCLSVGKDFGSEINCSIAWRVGNKSALHSRRKALGLSRKISSTVSSAQGTCLCCRNAWPSESDSKAMKRPPLLVLMMTGLPLA